MIELPTFWFAKKWKAKSEGQDQAAHPTAWLAQRSLPGRRYVVAQRRMDVAVMF